MSYGKVDPVRKVIIAEDDNVMTDLLTEVLSENGYEVCGFARNADGAVALCELHNPDFAILDVVLADDTFGPDIAARLTHKRRPGILYATGYRNHGRLSNAIGEACLGKPYGARDIVRALEIVGQIVSTGDGSRPYPRGFFVLAPQIDDARHMVDDQP